MIIVSPARLREPLPPSWIPASVEVIAGDAMQSAPTLPESLKVKGTEAAGELLRTVDPKAAAKADADKAIRAYETPAPAAASKPAEAPAPSYPSGDRRQLDRVIGTQR